MATAKKLPSGAWRIQLYVGKDENGKTIRESITAPTKREVEEKARIRQQEIDHGKFVQSDTKELTVGEAIDNYITFRDAVLSPKTIREYRHMRETYCKKLMPIKVRVLTENEVQRAINELARTHSPKTVRNFLCLLTPSVKAVDRSIDFHINLPQPEKKEMSIPENDVLEKLMSSAKGTELYIPILLASTCGLRRSEIAALDYKKDFDRDNNTVTINKAVVRNYEDRWETKKPKSTAGYRTVKVPGWVMTAINEAADRGEHPCDADYMTNGFKRITRQLGITGIRFHDLRHYYASTLLALGVPDKYAMARMGHSTPNMLQNVYQHLMKDKDKELDETIEAHFDTIAHTEVTAHETAHDSASNTEKHK